MVQILEKQSKDTVAIVASLSKEFAKTVVERDAFGESPKHEVELLRDSGLLKLRVPKEYGGIGETSWLKSMKIVQEIAKANGSLAQLYGNHTNLVTIPESSGTHEQQERYYWGTFRHNWFWANPANVRDLRLLITPEGDEFRLNGVKSFCSGASISDILVVGAVEPGGTTRIFAAIPSDRSGIIFNDDWDNMGQRQTDSGSVTFENVRVLPEEIFTSAHPPDSAIAILSAVFDRAEYKRVLQTQPTLRFEHPPDLRRQPLEPEYRVGKCLQRFSS